MSGFWRVLSRDGKLLFATRGLRMFAYGLLSVVLALYLAELGFSETEIGLLLSLTLAGDVVVSLAVTTVADRVGRRKMLLLGSALMVLAGLVFSVTRNVAVLTLAAVVGTISPSGNEVGPFLAIEQAALSQIVPGRKRTDTFAWYSLAGSLATALGALAGGALAQEWGRALHSSLEGFRAVIIVYGLLGITLGALFCRLSGATEFSGPDVDSMSLFGLEKSRSVVFRLSGLFMLDAFAGGLIVQSLIAYWFHIRFGTATALIGAVFFGANLLAGFSALLAARIAARIGLINTMVWTHIPSNILLILIPLMPNFPSAVLVLLARFSISQMDVPTRQSYTMAVVDPAERAAAAGITNVARTAASSLAPLVTGRLFGTALLSFPFFVSGGLKILYDIALYAAFRLRKPPEEL
jgi:MFS family permease